MRWTKQRNPDIRDVRDGELWVGIMDDPRPHIALATKNDGKLFVSRFSAKDARDMGLQLIDFADVLDADQK
jgi:septum formation inhibitor-activating ATPase MinD